MVTILFIILTLSFGIASHEATPKRPSVVSYSGYPNVLPDLKWKDCTFHPPKPPPLDEPILDGDNNVIGHRGYVFDLNRILRRFAKLSARNGEKKPPAKTSLADVEARVGDPTQLENQYWERTSQARGDYLKKLRTFQTVSGNVGAEITNLRSEFGNAYDARNRLFAELCKTPSIHKVRGPLAKKVGELRVELRDLHYRKNELEQKLQDKLDPKEALRLTRAIEAIDRQIEDFSQKLEEPEAELERLDTHLNLIFEREEKRKKLAELYPEAQKFLEEQGKTLDKFLRFSLLTAQLIEVEEDLKGFCSSLVQDLTRDLFELQLARQFRVLPKAFAW